MKTVLTALALVAGLAACNERGQDSARVGEGVDAVDTSITTRTTQDTTIITRDTQVDVDVDTTVKEGEVRRQGEMGRDTLNR